MPAFGQKLSSGAATGTFRDPQTEALVGRPAAQLELAIDRKAAITKRAPAFDLDFAIGRYAT
jgi:hypothetical protein